MGSGALLLWVAVGLCALPCLWVIAAVVSHGWHSIKYLLFHRMITQRSKH